MLDRQWKYPLEYAADLYVKANNEHMDGFIYEARSLYTLLIAKLQSYTFTFDEIEECIRTLKHKIRIVCVYLTVSCVKYLELIRKIEIEVNEIKQREAK